MDLTTQIEVYDEESRCDREELDQRFLDLGIDDIEYAKMNEFPASRTVPLIMNLCTVTSTRSLHL